MGRAVVRRHQIGAVHVKHRVHIVRHPPAQPAGEDGIVSDQLKVRALNTSGNGSFPIAGKRLQLVEGG